MARNCLYRTADNVVLSHGFVAFTPGAGEAIALVPEDFSINRRTERFDSNAQAKKRSATAQELTDYDNAVVESEATLVAARKELQAVALAVLDAINTLRALHSLSDVTAQQMYNAIKAKYKTL